MNFTVVFKSEISQIYTYGLVLIPTVCWIDGNYNDNILFNSNDICYKLGYVKELMKAVNEKDKNMGILGCFDNIEKEDKKCIVVVNNTGYGDIEILELLIKDLHNEGFQVQIIYL